MRAPPTAFLLLALLAPALVHAAGDDPPDFVIRRYANLKVDDYWSFHSDQFWDLADRLTPVLLQKLRGEPRNEAKVLEVLEALVPHLGAAARKAALATYDEFAGLNGILTRRHAGYALGCLDWYALLAADAEPYRQRRISELCHCALSKSVELRQESLQRTQRLPPDDEVAVYRTLLDGGDEILAQYCLQGLLRLGRIDETTVRDIASGRWKGLAKYEKPIRVELASHVAISVIVGDVLRAPLSRGATSRMAKRTGLDRVREDASSRLRRLHGWTLHQAVTGLAMADWRTAEPLLRKLAADGPGELRAASLRALGDHNVQDSNLLAAMAFQSADREVRCAALQMSWSYDRWSRSEILVRGTQDPDPAVRRDAAYWLGCSQWADDGQVAIVGGMLADKDHAVRLEAAKALQRIVEQVDLYSSPHEGEVDTRAQKEAEIWSVVAPIVASQGFQRGLADRDPVLSLNLQYVANPEFRDDMWRIGTEYEMATPDVARSLLAGWHVLKSGDRNTALRMDGPVAWWLGYLVANFPDRRPGWPELCTISASPFMRDGFVEGVDTIQVRPDGRTWESLAHFIHDPDIRIRTYVCQLLTRPGRGKRATALLREMVSDPDYQIRHMAAAACIRAYYGPAQ